MFEKRSRFVIMREKVAIKGIEEQMKKSNIKNYHGTTTLLDKFQKELAKPRKIKKSLIPRLLTKFIHWMQY